MRDSTDDSGASVSRETSGSKDLDSFAQKGIDIGALVSKKNKAYGNSAQTAVDMLKLLYPKGVKPENYRDVLLIVRIWDKMMRIATQPEAFGESPYQDIAGYGVLGAVYKDQDDNRRMNG
jgi:hypothetical protein